MSISGVQQISEQALFMRTNINYTDIHIFTKDRTLQTQRNNKEQSDRTIKTSDT